MEKVNFRDNLNAIYDYFGKEKAYVSLHDAAKYCGIDYRTLIANKTFPLIKAGRYYKVPLVNLARWLS